MKVYIVFGWDMYEPKELLGVFSTQEKAKKVAKQYKASSWAADNVGKYEYTEVEEREVL